MPSSTTTNARTGTFAKIVTKVMRLEAKSDAELEALGRRLNERARAEREAILSGGGGGARTGAAR